MFVACFGDAESVEAEQHSERGVGSVVVFGDEQEAAQFASVRRVLFGRFDFRTADVLGGVRRDPAVDVGEAVVAAHRRQQPIDRRRSKPALFHRGAIDLDVGSGRVEHGEVLIGCPLEVVAQVVAVGLEGAPVVPGQECGSRYLGFVG